MKKPFCHIHGVCNLHCDRDLRDVFFCLLSATLNSGPRELSAEHRAAIDAVHAKHAWFSPESIELRGGFVVVDYEVPDRLAIPHRTFGQDRLLGIREALLPFGFNDYRVNVNGPPPGTGLTRRYGSARFIEGGRIEWLRP